MKAFWGGWSEFMGERPIGTWLTVYLEFGFWKFKAKAIRFAKKAILETRPQGPALLLCSRLEEGIEYHLDDGQESPRFRGREELLQSHPTL